MYEFVDVTPNESASVVLPSEALQINGEYIENLVEGYRTLTVSGRESLSPELATYETGARDGSKLQNKRYPARTIIVGYQLIAPTNEAFREAYNKLAQVLDVEEAELIFNDEQDKFFVGTPSLIGDVEPGRNAVTGEFEILCVDPFKYSVEEYEVEASAEEQAALIDYHGTYKAFPKLEAAFYSEQEFDDEGSAASHMTGAGDCGYVAFFNDRRRIIQLGSADEVDADKAKSAQTLINQSFKTSTAWGKDGAAAWAINSASLPTTTVEQRGSATIGAAAHKDNNNIATSGTLVKKTTSTDGNPKITYTVTATASNRTETSVDVALTFKAAVANTERIGKDRVIKVHVNLKDKWYGTTFKSASEIWAKGTTYTKKLTVTVKGLTTDTESLTGIKFKAERTGGSSDAGDTKGEWTCDDLTIRKYETPTPSAYFLTAADYGSGNTWHGVGLTRNIPADASGVTGAANFKLTFVSKTCIGKSKTSQKELGAFQVQLTEAGGGHIAGARIYKNKTGTVGRVAFYINGVRVYDTVKDYNISFTDGVFGKNNEFKTSTIEKSGSKVAFNICGIKKTFTKTAIKNKQAAQVSFVFEEHSSYRPLTYNGLRSVKFVKNNCDTWYDVPNKFSADDVVVADCNSGEVLLNDDLAPELGALGNDWEEFYLVPGFNQIGYSYSDWVADDHAPTVKVKYREVFL